LNRAYKYQIYPTFEQQTILTEYFGSVRYVWNKMLEANINEYQACKKFVWSQQYQKNLPAMKKTDPWLKLIPSQALQQKCDDLQKALKMTVSKRAKRFGFPKFKSKHANKQSFRIPQQNNQIKILTNQIIIPKLGAINWKYHRPANGAVKFVTIKRHNNKYYAIVLCELPDKQKTPIDKDQTAGIDLGLTTFAVLSNGQEIATPKFYRKQQGKLKRAQQRLSRRQKGSANRNKAKHHVQKIHNKIANQRHNFIHQESRWIANTYSAVYVEDLNIDAIKKRFGKSTSDQGWGMFVNALAYKCNHFDQIGRFVPSTKTCSNCGAIHEMKLSDREMHCNQCGHRQSRDLNAAINIRFWGLASTDPTLFVNTSGTEEIHACGDEHSTNIAADILVNASLKQEKFLGQPKKPSVL